MYDIYRSCSAIFFFGTPHQGANAATYGEMIGRVVGALPLSPSVYKEVLYGLKPNGEKISSVVGRFNDVLDRQIPERENILIYSFQEGKPLAGLAGFDGKVRANFKNSQHTSPYFSFRLSPIPPHTSTERA